MRLMTEVENFPKPRKRKIDLFPYWLSLPSLLIILGLVGFPFVFSIWISFTDRVVGGEGTFNGIQNFIVLAKNATFQSAVWNTIVIVVVACALKFLIGLGLALLVNEKIPLRGFLRSFLMLPWAMPAFVAFLTWRVMYQPIGGGINLILTETGLYPHVIDFLGQRSTAMPSVIASAVWRGFPFWFISFLAALQGIPKELYEAARIDGANAFQRFCSVTWPGIRNVVIVTTLLSSIWTANAFEHVFLLTGGGPSDATITFPVLAYYAIQTHRIGEAAAVSVFMLPVLVVLVFAATSFIDVGDDR